MSAALQFSANPAVVELMEAMAEFEKRPYDWALFSFPWGEGELKDFDGPDEWQKEALLHIQERLESGEMTPQQAIDWVIQMGVSSGHGIGKSALVSMIILWGLSTFEDTKIVVTANTEPQLRTKTWPELAKWHRLFIGRSLFKYTATALHSVDPAHEKTWRADAITWSLNNTEAFAGLHNQGKRIIVIFDEASGIADKVWEVTEGALTDKDTQILWLAFGNPTRRGGRFSECFRKLKHRWWTRRIDSRTVKHTNKAQIQKWIEDYGEDSDFVKIRVRGLEPNTSPRQFIPGDLVDAARGRHLNETQYRFAPVIIGVDPAYSGKDDYEIYLRQGLMSKHLATFRGAQDDNQLAGRIARWEDEFQADAVFVDLAYGTGIVSGGRLLGRRWQLIAFGGGSDREGYLNKRADMWAGMREWLQEGGALPPDEICDELTWPESYVNAKGVVVLESKEDMEKRGLPSPNRADALALTFARPVQKKNRSEGTGHQEFSGTNYHPFRKG